MPSLPLSRQSADSVRAYLEGVLPDSQLTDASVQSGYEPLLLLQTKHVMAAFAFSNGDMRKSYEDLYGGFKNTTQNSRDAGTPLIRVCLLRTTGVPNLDRFCSNLETDVYFCRKFVVPLVSPLDASLARLPFLPLTPLHGQSMRPPSAQTFLQQCGVPPMLAKFLVVQRERSPEGIVEDCMDGRFGEPVELTPALNAPVAHIEPPPRPVRLESIVIKDFRAYRKPRRFSWSRRDRALWSERIRQDLILRRRRLRDDRRIGRIKSSGEDISARPAKHLDSKSEESVVSLFFIVQWRLAEDYADGERSKTCVAGRPVYRPQKRYLAELDGRATFPATDRVENFVSLFRATHLFSQEHQELTKDFQNDCELSEQDRLPDTRI